MSSIEVNGVFWAKIVTIVILWCEAYFCGIFPTLSKNCRENPAVLGVANCFSAGVFIALCLVHILPEEVEAWDGIMAEKGVDDEPFPLPYVIVFCGYTLLLLVDKVAFDTHAAFDDHDHHGAQND